MTIPPETGRPSSRRPVFGFRTHGCVTVNVPVLLTKAGHPGSMDGRAGIDGDPPPAGVPARQRRLWGVRLVVLAATAAALGMSQSQLSRSQAAGATMSHLAARQNVSAARVRSVALAAADPLLD